MFSNVTIFHKNCQLNCFNIFVTCRVGKSVARFFVQDENDDDNNNNDINNDTTTTSTTTTTTTTSDHDNDNIVTKMVYWTMLSTIYWHFRYRNFWGKIV